MNILKFFTLLFFASFFSIHIAHAQTSLSEATRKADVQPAWPGCDPRMPDCTKARIADFIAANLQVPLDAKKESIGGVVAMEFVIEKTGVIGEIHAMHDPGMGLVAEATRVISLINDKKIKFTPAEDDGKRIAFRYIVPVSFNVVAPQKDKPAVKMASLPADGIYEIVQVMPRYQGCEKVGEDSLDCTFRKMVSHIKSNLKYPEEALNLKVSGQVVVEFVIDTNGVVTRPSIKQGIGAGCDAEALRIVSSMPAWNPGMQDGKAVPVRMKVPMYFQLPKEKEKQE